MLFLPEMCGFLGAAPGESLAQAEPPVGEESPNHAAVTEWLQRVYEKTFRNESIEEDEEEQQQLLILTTAAPDTAISLVDGLRTLARTSQMWISMGGMHVLGAPSHPRSGRTRCYNTHVVLDDTGTVRALYRKIHLFDVSIPGKVNLMESNSTAAGKEIVLCDTPVGKRPLYCVSETYVVACLD